MPLAAFGLALLLAAGCGTKPSSDEPAGSARPGGREGAGGALDQGPRAAASPVDDALAEAGEKLFQEKGCSACHGFGKRATGPDLRGVSERRTARWIRTQIMQPERMVKEDPIARQLFAQFALQMPNQGVTQEQARALIEFFKEKDRAAGESEEEREGGGS
jgi:mono/diheme cytochrome c family protein